MASIKETPRQKLISIMYLILLALLALQVSSAIMEKFKFLDDSMSYTNKKMDANASLLERTIQKGVEDLGNKASDRAWLDKSKSVREASKIARDYIDDLRGRLVVETGGYENPKDPNSMFAGAKDEGKVEDLMIGAKKSMELQKIVNGYCEKLRKILGDNNQYPNLALDPKDDPRIAESSEHKNKSYAEFNFEGTPMVAAMALLSNLESDIIKYELQALESIQKNVGNYIIQVDKIQPMYRAMSNTVVAGTKYKAEIFLGATSSASQPLISANGRNLQVNNEGVGSLEFLASHDGVYGVNGLAKKKWIGKVTFKNRGKDTTMVIEGEYQVAKPYVDVQAATPPEIFRNCANSIKLSCPPLGADFNPEYTGSAGGEIIKGSKPGEVSLVPSQPEMSLKITNNGASLDMKKFKVRLVPKPILKIFDGNKEVNVKNGLTLQLPNYLKVVASPDENFARVCPSDSRFNVSELMLYVIRGRKPMQQPLLCKNGVVDLKSAKNLALAQGDRIYIETTKIERLNFRGQKEIVNISESWNLSLSNP